MRLKAIFKLARCVLIPTAVLIAAFLAAMIYFAVRCKGTRTEYKVLSTAAPGRKTVTAPIKDYARPEESTYLTYPEWYIVWSYQEKADFQERHLPSGFPYFAAITQYWRGYCCVYSLTRTRYPFNFGDHVMLAVIGSSFSGEYALKGVYEKTIGKLTEWLSSTEPVEEDRYAYKVAREYADFVHIRPFYEFSFWKRLKGLWGETSAWSRHPVRKWERKIFLSLDYTAEAFYCWLIERLTRATYGVEGSETYAWIENAPEHPRVRRVREVGPKSFVVAMPRYQEFTTVASDLARHGATFVEIAGNDEIVLTALVPRGWKSEIPGASVLFNTEIPSRPEMARVALRCSVSSLHRVLNALPDRRIQIEHVYDY